MPLTIWTKPLATERELPIRLSIEHGLTSYELLLYVGDERTLIAAKPYCLTDIGSTFDFRLKELHRLLDEGLAELRKVGR